MKISVFFSVILFTYALIGAAKADTVESQDLVRACIGQQRLDELRFFDIRDQVRFKTDLQSTSKLLMKSLEDEPERYVGLVRPGTTSIDDSKKVAVRFYPEGAKGPEGKVVSKGGQKVYSITSDPVYTRENAILGVEFEEIKEIQCDSEFTLSLIMFVHDKDRFQENNSNGYFFRRLLVNVDWTTPGSSTRERIQVLKHIEDIPLASTKFKVLSDLLERKVILEDKQNQITKVFPVGIGGFDIRTAPSMDGYVSSSTHEFPDGELRPASQTTKVNNGHGSNTRSRVWPSYYSGRPFIALFDPKKGYRAIGMHYQIESDLTRGFISSGCIRVRDQDLYQLDAILNGGPQMELEAEFVYDLKGYEHIDHPMPKVEDWYRATVYSNYRSDNVVKCPLQSYTVRRYGNYHTVANENCLTEMARRDRSPREVIDYIRGVSTQAPESFVAYINHAIFRPKDQVVVEDSVRRRESQDSRVGNNRERSDADRQRRIERQRQEDLREARYERDRAERYLVRYCREGTGYDRYYSDCMQARDAWRYWDSRIRFLDGGRRDNW